MRKPKPIESSNSKKSYQKYETQVLLIEAKMPVVSENIKIIDYIRATLWVISGLLIMTIYILTPFAAVANSFDLNMTRNVVFAVLIVGGMVLVVYDILQQTSSYQGGGSNEDRNS